MSGTLVFPQKPNTGSGGGGGGGSYSNSAALAADLGDETGTGVAVFNNSPTLVTPVLGVATATSINKVAITAPATSATLTIANGKTLTVSNTLTFSGTDSSSVAFGAGGTAAYTGNKLSVFAPTSSSELAGVISDETGSDALVFANTPTLVTPVLGAATATSINGLTITSSTGTLTITNGKTASFSNTLTFTGTDSSSVAFGAGGTVAYTANKLSVFASTSSSELAGVISDETGSGALVFANTPTLVTPALGTPGSGTLTNCTGLPVSTGISGLGSNVATFLATPSSANLASAVTDETGSGALVFANSPTFVTPNIDSATGSSLAITVSAGTGTVASGFVITGGAHTALTASTERFDNNFNGARTVQWATGALTTQRFTVFQAPTIGFVGASTVTDTATVSITGAPVKGTNATLTSTHGLLIEAGAVSTATTAYGLTVNSPTGASTNYAAQFKGGPVILPTQATDYIVIGPASSSGVALAGNSNQLLVRRGDNGAGGALQATTITATTAFTTTGTATTKSSTAATSGGALAYIMGSGATFGIYWGSGAPSVSAAKGSLYLRTDGSTTNDRAYINTDGSTTWTAITTVA